MQWTQADLRSVTIITLFNGLWLGVLSWLVLGLWLEWLSFLTCWIGATVISWPIAILRVGRAIGVRDEVLEEMRAEKEIAKGAEVRAVLEAIDEVEQEKDAEGLGQIKDLVVREVVEDPEKTKHSITEDGLSPRTLAFLIMLNVLGRELTSGKYHIYRGVLSAAGERLLNLWAYAVQQQHKSGYYDAAAVRKDMDWIAREIKKVG